MLSSSGDIVPARRSVTHFKSILTFFICLATLPAAALSEPPRLTPDCVRTDTRPLDSGPRACFPEPYYVLTKPLSGVEGWVTPGWLVDVLAVFKSEEKGEWVKVVACGAMVVSSDSYRCDGVGNGWLSIGIVLSEPQRQFLLALEKRSDFSQFSLSLLGGNVTAFSSNKLEDRIPKLCECVESCKDKPPIQMSADGQITGLSEHCACQKDCLGFEEELGAPFPVPQKPRLSSGPTRTKIRMNGRNYRLDHGRLVLDPNAN